MLTTPLQTKKAKRFFLKVTLALIVMLGLYLRVGAVLKTEIDTPVRADARLYYLYSLNLQHSGTFSHTYPDLNNPVPDARVPPLLPLAITPMLTFPPTDKMLINIGLVQALLGTLTILIAFLLIKEIVGWTGGLLVAGLTAISPHLISLTTYMLTETLFTFLMMGGLLFAVYMFKHASARYAILAGLFMGLAALTRFTLEYFPLFLILAMLLLPACRKMEVCDRRNVLVFALISLAVIGVWKIRNIIVLGALSDPSLLVAGLQSGMYPGFMFDGRVESLGIPYRFDPRTAEFTNVSIVLDEIARRFQAAPLLHLEWYLIGKPIALLSWSMIDGWGDIFVYPVNKSPYFSLPVYQGSRLVMLLLHPFLMTVGFICSLVALLRPNWLGIGGKATLAVVMLALLTIYFILLHMIGAPFPRYGVPLRPVMYGLATVFLIVCFRCGFKRLNFHRDQADQQ